MTTVIECRPPSAAPTPDLKALKAKQRAAWTSGDYAVVGTTLQIVGERLAEAMDLRPGQKVLDIAAGNGNVTLAAARRWCDVTSTDYVDALLAGGRKRAEAEGLQVNFQNADAEDLPFADGAFDAVASTFGAMFSPDQSRTATEMLRVCKSGGRIGLANWTPDGFIGQMFKTIGKHLPPPAGVKSLPRCLPRLLRAHAEGVRGARRKRQEGAGPRHHRSGRPLQPVGRRDNGRSKRISRSRRDEALIFGSFRPDRSLPYSPTGNGGPPQAPHQQQRRWRLK
jgi:SAM-dependent methyltransferase